MGYPVALFHHAKTSRRWILRTVVSAQVALASVPVAVAAIWEVPGDFAAIQVAIDAAAEGDSVRVAPVAAFSVWTRRPPSPIA
jgi:hypothetical protein